MDVFLKCLDFPPYNFKCNFTKWIFQLHVKFRVQRRKHFQLTTRNFSATLKPGADSINSTNMIITCRIQLKQNSEKMIFFQYPAQSFLLPEHERSGTFSLSGIHLLHSRNGAGKLNSNLVIFCDSLFSRKIVKKCFVFCHRYFVEEARAPSREAFTSYRHVLASFRYDFSCCHDSCQN